MSGQIFISYRREESRWSARSLHDRLCRDFDPKQIFMDIDAIALGEDFFEAIETTVAKCDVLIAVIGKNWLTSKDDHGNRRLDNPEDFVRMEIGAALKRKIRVIPVLVDGALMPQSTDLPEDLRPLVRRNALLITDTSFDGDCQRLAAAIKLVLEKAAAEQRQREEKERLAAEQQEKERLATEQRQHEEQERLAAQQREKERLETEQREKERLEAEQREKERLEAEQREKERLEHEQQLPLERATKEHPWVNSLGMKFVPVAGTQVLFSVWDTRVQDFEAFVADTNYDATEGMWSLDKDGWKQRGPTHPVAGVSWKDAKKFCEWLTGREQGSGMLPRGRVYRLPTDAEWSAGVGLQGEEGNNPIEKDGKIKLYPWGKEWPPPKGAGNYAGEESKITKKPSDWGMIKGYNDGYPRTSPVGSFAANANGLYDMGGNVWQWCEDWYHATGRVLRGASWSSYNRDSLLASSRALGLPDAHDATIGFRCVVAAESSR